MGLSVANAVAGTFVKFDAVPTRKVVRITIEAPIEKADDILKELGGFPDPSKARWVGIAPLVGEPQENTLKGGKLAQSAGIMCGEKAFQQYTETIGFDKPEDAIYEWCGVTSRTHLDHDDEAARLFKDMKASYEAWLRT